MKYIRTKDGKIHGFLGKYKDEFGFYYLDTSKENKYRCDSNYYKDCKEADTIEELCDYCLYYNCYDDFLIRKMPLSTSLESLYRDMQNKMVKDIKLATKTDKGIIYVAKMNDKGDLELL